MALRAISGAMGLSQGLVGPEALMQCVHSRLHQVPVTWIQRAEKRRKGATGACTAPGSLTIKGRLTRLDMDGSLFPLLLFDTTRLRRGSLAAEYIGAGKPNVTTA